MIRTISSISGRRVAIFTLMAALVAFLMGPFGLAPAPAAAAPASPVDTTQVPHYFGPYPNWANSQFTLPDVGVAITGDGTGMERDWASESRVWAEDLPDPEEIGRRAGDIVTVETPFGSQKFKIIAVSND